MTVIEKNDRPETIELGGLEFTEAFRVTGQYDYFNSVGCCGDKSLAVSSHSLGEELVYFFDPQTKGIKKAKMPRGISFIFADHFFDPQTREVWFYNRSGDYSDIVHVRQDDSIEQVLPAEALEEYGLYHLWHGRITGMARLQNRLILISSTSTHHNRYSVILEFNESENRFDLLFDKQSCGVNDFLSVLGVNNKLAYFLTGSSFTFSGLRLEKTIDGREIVYSKDEIPGKISDRPLAVENNRLFVATTHGVYSLPIGEVNGLESEFVFDERQQEKFASGPNLFHHQGNLYLWYSAKEDEGTQTLIWKHEQDAWKLIHADPREVEEFFSFQGVLYVRVNLNIDVRDVIYQVDGLL